jgi:hypothetical protein
MSHVKMCGRGTGVDGNSVIPRVLLPSPPVSGEGGRENESEEKKNERERRRNPMISRSRSSVELTLRKGDSEKQSSYRITPSDHTSDFSL